MSTSAERQRKRRKRLRQQGVSDVTVPVPKAKANILRRFAKNLSSGLSAPIEAGRLLDVIQALKSIRPVLKDAGIKHAGVFGSAARCDYGPDSDIDILIDIDVERVGDVLKYIEITDIIKTAVRTKCPDVDVDVADQATLKPRIRERAEVDAVYAF
jgi:uncharacterized protein